MPEMTLFRGNRSQRKSKVAGRLAERAESARAKGNEGRANRLQAKSERYAAKSSKFGARYLANKPNKAQKRGTASTIPAGE